MASYIENKAVLHQNESYFGVSIDRDEIRNNTMKMIRKEHEKIPGYEVKAGEEIEELKIPEVTLQPGNVIMIKKGSSYVDDYNKTFYRVHKILNRDEYGCDVILEPFDGRAMNVRIEFSSHYLLKEAYHGKSRDIHDYLEDLKSRAYDVEREVTPRLYSIKIVSDKVLCKYWNVDDEKTMMANLI